MAICLTPIRGLPFESKEVGPNEIPYLRLRAESGGTRSNERRLIPLLISFEQAHVAIVIARPCV